MKCSPQTADLIEAIKIGWEMIQSTSHVLETKHCTFGSISHFLKSIEESGTKTELKPSCHHLLSSLSDPFLTRPSFFLPLWLYTFIFLSTTWIYCSSGLVPHVWMRKKRKLYSIMASIPSMDSSWVCGVSIYIISNAEHWWAVTRRKSKTKRA